MPNFFFRATASSSQRIIAFLRTVTVTWWMQSPTLRQMFKLSQKSESFFSLPRHTWYADLSFEFTMAY